MEAKYTVPVIPQNLYKHETIIQIAEVLEHLTNVSENIFLQINNRLESNKTKLSDISNRVNIVNKKINTLRGAKTATQVFSSSKYPATDVYEEYRSVFHNVPSIELKRHKIKLKNAPVLQGSLEKLQFYHVNIPKTIESRLEGLGDIPESTEFVNDLLLYNSGKNLYKDFVISYPTKSPKQVKKDEEHESEIGAAPHSISERSTQTKSHSKQSYFYSPQIGEVPALDVPLDLPDLPGIANDLHYDNEVSSSIAPSADITPSILELDLQTCESLPVIPQEDEPEDIPNISISELPLPEIQRPESVNPPPTDVIKSETPIEVKTKPDVIETKSPETTKSTKSLPPVDDLRSSLMEAIRNAGGSAKAKLKSSSESKEKAVATTSTGGDLMADLHNKLFMRRKGISGAKQSQENNSIDADSYLSKISSMIPPPELNSSNLESTSNDEEEWDE